MEIKIRRLGGIEHADLSGDKIILVAGPNGAGKTSILRAVGAALARDPAAGFAKKAAGGMVRAGFEAGGAQVIAATGKIELAYPKATVTTEGEKPPHGSAYAAGMGDILALNDKERVSVMAQYLGATPVKDDLAPALADAKIPLAFLDPVWLSIYMDGWDAAHVRAKDKGANLKGQWEATTGENYGSAKAEKWLPAGWTDDIGAKSVETLDGEVTTARTALEQAIGTVAVRADELDRLRASAAGVPELQIIFDAAKLAVEIAKAEFETAEAAFAALPPLPGDQGAACPHCGKGIKITVKSAPDLLASPYQTTIEAIAEAPKFTPAQLKKAREDHASASGAVGRTRAAWNGARQAFQTAEQAAEDARHAQQRIDEIGDAAEKGNALEVERARESVRAAEAALDVFKKKSTADRLAAGITVNQELVHVLAPDGLRRTVLTRAIEKFNKERLDPLAQAAGWGPIDVQPDLSIAFRGRTALLSNGERWRVRAAMQVAFAQIEGASLVVLDEADILDGQGRNGLIRMLLAAKVPALIGMTYAKPGDAPDLAKAGGVTYWLQGARAVPLAEAIGARAA